MLRWIRSPGCSLDHSSRSTHCGARGRGFDSPREHLLFAFNRAFMKIVFTMCPFCICRVLNQCNVAVYLNGCLWKFQLLKYSPLVGSYIKRTSSYSSFRIGQSCFWLFVFETTETQIGSKLVRKLKEAFLVLLENFSLPLSLSLSLTQSHTHTTHSLSRFLALTLNTYTHTLSLFLFEYSLDLASISKQIQQKFSSNGRNMFGSVIR